MTKPRQLAILVQSCDAYADAWEPFFQLFDRYWPNCPYPLYLVSETKTCSRPNTKMIHTGAVNVWSDMLSLALSYVSEEHILYLLEDYFLNKLVSTEQIAELLEHFVSQNIDSLRLYPCVTLPLVKTGTSLFGKVDPQEPFFVSTQASIWKRVAMQAIIVSNESGWDFERNGSKRARAMKANYCSVWISTKIEDLDKGDYPIRYLFLTSITRGRWTMKTVRFCRKNGIALDLTVRKANNWLDEIYMSNAPLWLRHLIDFVNARTKRYFSVDIRSYPMIG